MNKVLHIVPNMQAGGLETFIMNVMRNTSEETQFDFLVHYQEEKFYDKEILELGGKIYRFSLRNDHNLIKYIFELDKFFKDHPEYKIIHCHMVSIGFLIFLIAKKNNVKVRIAHSHNISEEKSLKGKTKQFLSSFIKYTSTHNLACSKQAGLYLFGKKKFNIVYNGIDLDKFKYNLKLRKKIRSELKISDDTMVIGHIGRFCEHKNHRKIIYEFSQYQKIVPNSLLILVGDGELVSEVKKLVLELNLEDKVKFLGLRKDTNALYSAFDLFLFPSISEGLGISLIEAQMSGLYCYTTAKTVPLAAKITDRLTYIPLELEWAPQLITKNNYDRKNIKFNKNKDNYDIKKVTADLESFYKNTLNE